MEESVEKRDRRERSYGSWDPLTQAKFIFEINAQASTPVSMPIAYQIAELGICNSISTSSSLEK